MIRMAIVTAMLMYSAIAVALGAEPVATTSPALTLEPGLRELAPGTPAGPFVKLKGGAVLCVVDDSAMVSRDRGRTWERHPMFQPGAFKVRPEYALVRSTSGAIVCLFINDLEKVWKWDAKTNASAVDAKLYVWTTRSTDDGMTWSAPTRVQDGYCGAIRDMIQTRDGDLVSPLQQFLPEHNRHATVPMVSTDDGVTWKRAGLLDVGGRGHHDGSIESTLVERRDGSLWMLLRTTHDVLYESISTDSGKSWSAPAPTTIDASSSPAIVKRLQSGRLMLSWNRLFPEGRTDYPRRAEQHSERAASWNREELAIAFSDDDGRTWSSPKIVARSKRVAYPFIFEFEPGTIWLTTMQGGLRAELKEADFVTGGK